LGGVFVTVSRILSGQVSSFGVFKSTGTGAVTVLPDDLESEPAISIVWRFIYYQERIKHQLDLTNNSASSNHQLRHNRDSFLLDVV
jgi:hypothetical protein